MRYTGITGNDYVENFDVEIIVICDSSLTIEAAMISSPIQYVVFDSQLAIGFDDTHVTIDPALTSAHSILYTVMNQDGSVIDSTVFTSDSSNLFIETSDTS